MRSLRMLPFALAGLVVSCGPAEEARTPPPPCPSAAPLATATAAPTASVTAAPTGSAYSGHGGESVPPEVLAKYAPPRLPPEVSRRIQAMLDVRSPGGGMLSPDAKQLFFSWTITGTRQLWRIDGPLRFPTQLTGGEDPTSIADITPDGAHLVVSRDRKGEEYPGLYLLDPKGGTLQEISHKPKVQTQYSFTTDDSKYVYFRANDKKADSYALYRYDIGAKSVELVFDQDGIWSIADHQGTEKLLLVKEVGSNMEEYSEYDTKSKKLTPLFGQGERENYQAQYGAGGEILVLTPKLGEFRRLYAYKDGKMTPVSPEMKHDVATFHIDDPRSRILYEINDGGYTRLAAMDAKTHKEIALPKLPPADHVSHVSTTHDGKYSILSIDPGNDIPSAWVLDWKSKKLSKWHSPSAPEVDVSTFARATLEEYPARDGTKIPMFVRRPKACEKAAEPCPVLVMFHGGPEAQAEPGFNVRSQLFVDAGFILAEPNVRGSDGYGKTWLHADDGPKRLAVITDIEDAAKYARKAWAVGGKAPKVGVMGGSYGGYSTLVAMTMFAGAYDAGASVVGISNLVTFLENTAPYRRKLRTSEYGDPEIPAEKEALVKLSPMTYLDKLSAPLLIIQGASDPRVPAGEAIQMKEALDAKKVPAELVLFADEGHGAQKRDNQVLQYGHMVRFFQEHLMGKK
ncbi:MAG: prolyl oligopeptidase family serine peptidase [Polyangiaceae bacterium]